MCMLWVAEWAHTVYVCVGVMFVAEYGAEPLNWSYIVSIMLGNTNLIQQTRESYLKISGEGKAY